ncbi:EAL domain-containing protein [Mesorhizobium sp. CGMCC 1.15528]|uniref:EAL domain-containing protein n=1 Tax=Mesorhizobium zhangyense TaxID=1776730 RepID=A0A7C9VC04_9HYPH|nr:EAL domain-containing protein [Mesorhizobium zhangyense]NGN41211.1 EAL domain-containing protein [Mesorhizobium zhangyense]
MSRSVGLNHVIRGDDGTATGVWGAFTLETAFQPIFAFRDGKLQIVAYEGLLRPSRDGVQVAPTTFFNEIAAADRLSVETLTRTLHLLNAAIWLDPDATIFVNFDPSIFTERSVVDNALRDLRLVLHEAGIEPYRVICEVTEQKAASQEVLYAFVEALRANGLRIAIDDYGAAESDITRIRELRPDIVKFDAQWIARLMETGAGFALLTSMVENFAEQGIMTVFEGIEEGWQLDLAERSGASMVQGFVLARPETVVAVASPLPETPPAELAVEPQPQVKPVHSARRADRKFGRRRPS